MKYLMIILGMLLLIGFASAECESGQIDINTASALELDKITYVGPATAENIINSRPFDAVDDLIKVYGIGDVKLEAIKTEGLACVDSEEVDQEPQDLPPPPSMPPMPPIPPLPPEPDPVAPSESSPSSQITGEVIELSPKDIKSEDGTQEENKRGIYLFVAFCILIAFLFYRRFKKRKNGLE